MSVYVDCEDSKMKKCYVEQEIYQFNYRKENVENLQILGFDATKADDDIRL